MSSSRSALVHSNRTGIGLEEGDARTTMASRPAGDCFSLQPPLCSITAALGIPAGRSCGQEQFGLGCFLPWRREETYLVQPHNVGSITQFSSWNCEGPGTGLPQNCPVFFLGEFSAVCALRGLSTPRLGVIGAWIPFCFWLGGTGP